MQPILEQFLDKWVWPTMPGAPGAEFRLRLTRERCVKGWEISLERTLAEIERELATNDEDWKKDRALRGYAAEGVHMSIKQMSGQLLSVDIADQERYIDLQRMRARQIWDECKHSKLHADVLLGKGWIDNERELMDIAQANTQPLPAYFGLSMMFAHIHPLARAAQNYYTEANACIGIMAYLDRVADPLVRHEHLSQRDEEPMHFIEGKFQIDFLCATPETQKPVEEALDYLLHQIAGIR
jgi:frataxin-like iron-binding protein CyaY